MSIVPCETYTPSKMADFKKQCMCIQLCVLHIRQKCYRNLGDFRTCIQRGNNKKNSSVWLVFKLKSGVTCRQ